MTDRNEMEDREEREELYAMSEGIRVAAEFVAKEAGVDPITTAMACGLAATRILFDHARGDDKLAMNVADIFAQSSLKSMADMVSGQDSHQVTQ